MLFHSRPRWLKPNTRATTRCDKGIEPATRLLQPIRIIFCSRLGIIMPCMYHHLWASALLFFEGVRWVKNGGTRVVHELFFTTNYDL